MKQEQNKTPAADLWWSESERRPAGVGLFVLRKDFFITGLKVCEGLKMNEINSSVAFSPSTSATQRRCCRLGGGGGLRSAH